MASKKKKAAPVRKTGTRNARAREATVLMPAEALGAAAIWLSPDDLTPWERNPRLNDATVARVVDSIQRFGFSAPIVARAADRRIIAGHTRWKAARQLGLEQVPVRLLDISEREASLLALADNRLTELTAWDVPELQDVLSGFDMAEAELVGWSQDDLSKMADGLLDAAEGAMPEALPEAPTHVQMTFTLSPRQKGIVDAALSRAKDAGASAEDNDNSNGNALTLVCEAFGG